MALAITIGLLVGFACGFLCATVLCAASRADDQHDQLFEEIRDRKKVTSDS